MIPRLLARLNQGLLLIRYPPEPIALFLDELSALHDKVLDEHRRAVAIARTAARDQAAAGEGPDSISDLIDGSDSAGQGDTGNAPLLPLSGNSVAQETYIPADQSVGAEVELSLDGVWVRAKLTWIGRNRSLFMFVSGAGLAHAMSRRTMDRLQAQGRIRVVEPVFDLLLESGVAPLVPEGPDDEDTAGLTAASGHIRQCLQAALARAPMRAAQGRRGQRR